MARPTRGDVVLAALTGVGVLVVALGTVTSPPAPSDVTAAVVMAAVVLSHLALVWRRARPVPATAVCLAATAAGVAAGFDLPVVAAPLAVMALVASGRPWAQVATVVGPGAAALVGGHVVGADDPAASAVRDLALLAAAAAVGAWQVARRAELAERVAAEAERRVAADRLALSRELHDLAAGTLTAVVVQAGLAERLLDRDPAGARAALADVGAESRGAIARLREVAATLRAGSVPEPHPVAATLDELVALYRRAGLTIEGTWPPAASAHLPPLALLVVQEALTNVLRHAAEGRATLEVTSDRGMLRIAVANPVDEPASGEDDRASGLAGVAERLAAAGGTLTREVVAGWHRLHVELPAEGGTP